MLSIQPSCFACNDKSQYKQLVTAMLVRKTTAQWGCYLWHILKHSLGTGIAPLLSVHVQLLVLLPLKLLLT
jgi:hypothetical protein